MCLQHPLLQPDWLRYGVVSVAAVVVTFAIYVLASVALDMRRDSRK